MKETSMLSSWFAVGTVEIVLVGMLQILSRSVGKVSEATLEFILLLVAAPAQPGVLTQRRWSSKLEFVLMPAAAANRTSHGHC